MANPFSQSNPFGDSGGSPTSGGGGGSTANPFADPSVTSASRGGATDNPFNSSVFGNSAPASPPPPAVSVSSFVKPDFSAPPVAKSAFGGGGEEDLRRKELELAQREQELLQRERQLAEQANNPAMTGMGAGGQMPRGNVNNWPKCAPVLYMDIKKEVQDGRRWVVWQMYIHWFGTMGFLALNLIGIITYLSSGGTSDPTTIAAEILMSICFLVIVPPVSFVLWYFPFYHACSRNSAMRFFPIFVTYGIHILFIITMILGIPSTGMAGFIKAIILFVEGGTAGGVILLVINVAFVVALIHAIMMYVKLVQLYRAAGGRAAAKQEAAMAADQARTAAMPYVAEHAGRFAAEGAKTYAQSKFGSGSR